MDARVVARLGSRPITVAEVDARMLALPISERPKPGEDLDRWYEAQVRALAVDLRLTEEAESSRLAESAAFVETRRDAELQIASRLCLARLRPETERVTTEDVERAYAEHKARFAAPERRLAYHLFVRRSEGASAEATRRRAASLRDRVLRGESFRRLAAETSDSESRHREGSLGWVVPGELPEGFEKAVFALEEGVPSEPVTTRDGAHLFYVEEILPARQLSLDEARTHLREMLVSRRRREALAAIEAQAAWPEGAVALDRDGLAAAVQAADNSAVVLRIDGDEVTLGELFRRTAQHRPPSRPGTPARGTLEQAWRMLQQLRARDLLVHQCRVQQAVPPSEIDEKLRQWRRAALPAFQRQRRMLELASRDAGRLTLFYESNPGLFSRPPHWHLRRLRVPMGRAPAALMARLEKAARAGMTLDSLRTDVGGVVDDLGDRTLAQLEGLEPKLPGLVAPLRPGQVSAPYRARDSLDMVEAVSWTDAQVLPFAEVRERVAAAYVQHYTREVYEELARQVLPPGTLHIVDGGLATLRQASIDRLEVSVEDLERLLDDM